MLKSIFAAAFALASPLSLASIPTFASYSSLAEARGYCGGGSYVNSRGHCVQRPRYAASAPAGASARCRDNTYSFSESRRGACSHHGGVASWL
ncbi:DUF3761 domain-containing protein [Sphingomonas flavescens]|uniref:DUF3761 domain-containing protein n=1 Tax=Sphingomonas flavescens TaxID=3132797 RepID=UPI003B20B95A